MCKPVSVLFLKHFMNGCRYLSGGKMKWSCFWIASVHIALYVRPPLCSLMYRPPSNEDNTSLWLMQHSFLLKSPPTWLAISVSVFALIGGKREVGGDTDHSFQTAYFNVHPSRGRNTVEMCVCVCVCVCMRCMWQDRSSSVSSVTPPGPSWAAANLYSREGRGQASAKTFMKSSTAPHSTSVCEPDWLARGFVHLVPSSQNDEVSCMQMWW